MSVNSAIANFLEQLAVQVKLISVNSVIVNSHEQLIVIFCAQPAVPLLILVISMAVNIHVQLPVP